MDTFRLFIHLCLLSLCTGLLFSNEVKAEEGRIKIITPKKKVELAEAAAIDTEMFELGFGFGSMAVEEASNNLSFNASFLFHINDKFMVQAMYGQTDIGQLVFDDISPIFDPITGDQLSFVSDDGLFKYGYIVGGYNLFPGRSFLARRNKFNSRIYLLGGVGQVNFDGSSNVGFYAGLSYRIVLTDWLTWNMDIRNHIFDRTNLFTNDESDSKITQNIELSTGFNLLF